MSVAHLASIAGSKMKAQELLLLLHKTKPVVRQGYYPDELKPVLDWAKRNDISFVTSPYKILVADSEKRFSDAGVRVPATDPRPGLVFIYLSRNMKLATQALKAEVMQDHKILGNLLGYPDCCAHFFAKTFTPQHTDLTLRKTHPLIRTDLREFDVALVSHFPCSENCVESMVTAQIYFDTLKELDPTWMETLHRRLHL